MTRTAGPWIPRLLTAGVAVMLAVAGVLLLSHSTGQATSGGSAYDVPVVNDTNPAADIVETTIVSDEASVDIGGGVTANAQTYNGTLPGPTFRLNVGDTVIVH